MMEPCKIRRSDDRDRCGVFIYGSYKVNIIARVCRYYRSNSVWVLHGQRRYSEPWRMGGEERPSHIGASVSQTRLTRVRASSSTLRLQFRDRRQAQTPGTPHVRFLATDSYIVLTHCSSPSTYPHTIWLTLLHPLAAAVDSDLAETAVVIVAEAVAVDAVAAAARARYTKSRLRNSGTIDNCAGEGMAACHQARPSRKGRQDQEHGGDVCPQ
jgi:hypothetical protein